MISSNGWGWSDNQWELTLCTVVHLDLRENTHAMTHWCCPGSLWNDVIIGWGREGVMERGRAIGSETRGARLCIRYCLSEGKGRPRSVWNGVLTYSYLHTAQYVLKLCSVYAAICKKINISVKSLCLIQKVASSYHFGNSYFAVFSGLDSMCQEANGQSSALHCGIPYCTLCILHILLFWK